MFSFSLSYLQANIIFRTQQTTSTTIFLVGNALLVILVVSFVLSISLLFDFEQNRFIDYQLSILHPKLIIIERIIFSSLFTFVLMLPFFPVSKLLLQDGVAMSNASWPQTFLMLYAGALFCSSYHLLAVCVMKNHQQHFIVLDACQHSTYDLGWLLGTTINRTTKFCFTRLYRVLKSAYIFDSRIAASIIERLRIFTGQRVRGCHFWFFSTIHVADVSLFQEKNRSYLNKQSTFESIFQNQFVYTYVP